MALGRRFGRPGLSRVTLEGLTPGLFTVRLYFSEPDRDPGDRTFDVSLGGRRPALVDFDIAREAGGRMRSVVREFKNVASDGTLTVTLAAKSGVSILCGLEIVANGLPIAAISTLKETR